MTDTWQSPVLTKRRPSPSAWLDHTARKTVAQLAAGIEEGYLRVVEQGETVAEGGHAENAPLSATLHVNDPRFYRAVLRGGIVGAGESYVAGHWDASDLTALMRILLRNTGVYTGLERGWTRYMMLAYRWAQRLHGNSRAGSRRNIAAHYDLGNAFFRLFLDETMTYSSGFFLSEDTTMAEASREKIDRLCRKLALQPGDHVLEIGTGWGSFALHAAERYGCRVTTTTISPNQYALARERVAQAALSGRVTVLQQDYRDLTGSYDKVVSIEMIEAIGYRNFDRFFAQCEALLKPGGALGLQAITTMDQYYPAYLRGADFIRRHVFPGGCLTSLGALHASVARATGMRWLHMEEFGRHYARTLRCWLERFIHHREAIRALGYDEPFLRYWEFYLRQCEAGFDEECTGVVQCILTRPGSALPCPAI